eukprot:XP_016661388.1 PREDICTED: uncharacterized protein LOC107884234 isoform X1 [Acyrthosiphon pisum]
MSDNFVLSLLNELKVPDNLIEEFQKQGIDEEAFRDLTELMVRELVPHIGFRSKIFKKIGELKSFNNTSSSFLKLVETSSAEYNVFDSGNLQQVQNVLNNDELEYTDQTLGQGSDKEVIESFMESLDHDNIAGSSTNVVWNDQNQCVTKKLVNSVSENCVNQVYTLPVTHEKRSVNDLKNILLSYHEGQIIIDYYKNHNLLNGPMRNKLSHLVISHTLKNINEKKISTTKLNALSQDIKDIFPNENIQTYYLPYKKESDKVTPTRGKLWDKYCNMRREIRNKKSTIQTKDNVVFEYDNNEEPTEEIIWLKNNLAPWNMVIEYWKKTFHFRYNSLSHKEKHYSYFSDLPAIKGPIGFTLIELDFEQLYPGKDLTLFTNFELFKTKIPNLIRNYKYKGIDSLVDEILTPTVLGYDNIAALKVLIELFKPINVCKRSATGSSKATYWRPSKLELKQSFIYYVNSTIQVKEVNEEKNKKAQRLQQTVQPYMIFVCGTESEHQISEFYVIINNHIFKVESGLKAVDICFKSFFALNLNYTDESKQVWYFIQKYFYKIETKYDKFYQNVNNLIHDINTVV